MQKLSRPSEVLASELIHKWKHERSLRARFPRFCDYLQAAEAMLDGRAPSDPTLFPIH